MRISALAAVLSLIAAPALYPVQVMAQTTPAPASPADSIPTQVGDPVLPSAPLPGPKMDLATYVKQPAYQAIIIATARDQIKQAIPACANATFKPTGQVTMFDPVGFNDGKPYAGAWVERIEATGCPVHALNVLTVAHADTPAQVVGMMPGDTHTDPMMQKNALQYAQAIAVRSAPASCKQLAFVDTKFDGFTGLPSPEVTDGRENRPWREVWTASICGALFDVSLTFTPNARGTALTGQNPVKHPG